jgi:hypothetical protein
MSGVLARIAGSAIPASSDTGETRIAEADIGDESLLAFAVANVNAGEAFRHPISFAQ